MNATQLKGFEILSKSIPQTTIKLVIKDINGIKEYDAKYSPLTGTISIAKIACSKSELALWLKKFYNATLIEIK